MTDGRELCFFVSAVRVQVTTNHALTFEALRAIWGHARCAIPTRHNVDASIVANGERGEVRLGSRQGVAPLDELLPTFELFLYEALTDWHPPPQRLVHAALVAVADAPVLIVGPSGAGKSTLALALVRLGAEYLTDEIVAFDGERVWGIPRAPQFDPTEQGAALPTYLHDADRTTYRFPDRRGRDVALPFVALEERQYRVEPLALERLTLVLPLRSTETRISACAPADALAALLSEVRGPVVDDLGALVGRRPLVAHWSDPHAAGRAVLDAL